MTAFAHIHGETLTAVSLHVPNIGPWWANVTFESAPEVSGRVTLSVGDLRLAGTLRPTNNGSFALQRKARIVAGGGGWGTLVSSRHYHNDAGVSALSVAHDAARLAGETLGAFDARERTLGIDYVRTAGPASVALEDAVGGAPWRVDYDGQTVVGARASTRANASSYQVLDYNPRSRVATLAVDDLRDVMVGSVISDGLDSEETIREIEIRVTADSVRVIAWTGGDNFSRGRLAQVFENAAQRVAGNRVYGKHRYRLVRMSGDRTELQAVARDGLIPDALPISMAPGVAGSHADLTPGTIVLVEFIEGNRALPMVTAFAGKDAPGHAPQSLTFDVVSTLRLGSASAAEGVPLGDSLKSWLDGHTHGYIPTGTGSPANTTAPIEAGYTGGSGVPSLSPSPSSRVKVS